MRILAALLFSATAAHADGFYCAGPASFAVHQNADKSVTFGVSMWTDEGSNFAVIGKAKRAGEGWRYTEPGCTVDITLTDAWNVSTKDGARCEAYAGHNAVLYGTLHFKTLTSPSTAMLKDMETFINFPC